MKTRNVDAQIDAVIFDFAGVLTTSPIQLMTAKAQEVGLTVTEAMPLMAGPPDEDTDHPWHRIERGEITYAELCVGLDQVFRNAGYERGIVPPTQEELLEWLHPVPEMLDVARSIRAAGIPTAILSNNIQEWSRWRELVGANELVDTVVDSSDVGVRKPTAAAFELTAGRLNTDVCKCLMVDDFAWNIRRAEELGMPVFHMTDPANQAGEVRDLVLGSNRGRTPTTDG